MAVRQFNLNRENLVCDVHHIDGTIYSGCDFADSSNERVFNFWVKEYLYSVPFNQIKSIVSYELPSEEKEE